ncbi:MAG: thioredoxin domain-containing protein [Holophagaceae bacterium]|nr:thioredoxin domain-containing protein [Holophagaceae bacterium]
MTNRLAESLSPYLLQHAHNPVAWQPWDEKALVQARDEDKPIFLSIGYSACHWCHVMERESFENPEVANLLNKQFIPIKVDREERPDLDDLYMDAVQTLTGHGGWPMSVWLTPDLRPFYGGTYFPPQPARGMPGFIPLLKRIAELWVERRSAVVEQAAELTQDLERQANLKAGDTLPDEGLFENALQQLRGSFDSRWGGFGGAPKFPPHMAIELILRRGSEADQRMAIRTLDAMWEGGMYDHLGGGFSRYSVDPQWLVPHFEKMLYDNAQLACCYLAAFQKTGDRKYAAIAGETLDYLLRDMRDASGGIHSSEDADSEGEEGKFYVFTPDEVQSILGGESARFCGAYGITAGGNFEGGASVLHVFDRKEEVPEGQVADLAALRERLREVRDTRIRPGKDDKVLAAWNGLALSAFARGAQVLDSKRYLDAAAACAEFIQRELWQGGTLLRVYRQGRAHTPGFLEDYAAVANGLVDVYEAGFDARWLRLAERIAEAMRSKFEDAGEGGFFSTEAGRSDLLFRQKPGFDNALPSGNTLAATALFRLSRHLERRDFRISAEGILACFAPWMQRAPRAFPGMINALDSALKAPLDIVIAGDLKQAVGLLAEVHQTFIPHRVLSWTGADPALPLHVGKDAGGGPPLAFVCEKNSCAAPVGDALKLRLLLLQTSPKISP